MSACPMVVQVQGDTIGITPPAPSCHLLGLLRPVMACLAQRLERAGPELHRVALVWHNVVNDGRLCHPATLLAVHTQRIGCEERQAEAAPPAAVIRRVVSHNDRTLPEPANGSPYHLVHIRRGSRRIR